MAESVGSETVQIENIEDDDELYRRLAPEWVTNGEVNSAAFKEKGKPRSSTPVYLRISVDLAKRTTAQEAVDRAPKPGFGLGVLVAVEPRDLGLTVRHDPVSDNGAHSVLEGDYVRATCRRLAELTSILMQPTRS